MPKDLDKLISTIKGGKLPPPKTTNPSNGGTVPTSRLDSNGLKSVNVSLGLKPITAEKTKSSTKK